MDLYRGFRPFSPEQKSCMSDGSNMKLVRDLMTVGVLTCSPETPVVEVARALLEKNLDAIVVLDPTDGHALGVVDQDDLVRAYSVLGHQALKDEGSSSGKQAIMRAAAIMQEGVVQVPPDIPLTAAAQIMLDKKVRTLFLMHHAGGIEYPAAYISYRHILRLLAARDEQELRDLGIHAERESPLDQFMRRKDEAKKRHRPSG